MTKLTPSLNRLISNSIAFESHVDGGAVSVFKYEGDAIGSLADLGFERQYFKETSTGRSLPSSMYFNKNTKETVFIFEDSKTFTFSDSNQNPVKY